jgi:hydrogenase expression/formation protein HypE
MSTDSFVVQPLFFPGGSIGELAVNGTVNDLAVSGAEPKF